MPKIVLIEKTGVAKTLTVKDFTEETLYKKAGFKTAEGFLLQHTWGAEDGVDQSIRLYGKKTGRAGQENKYDFPPPVDEVLFFGPCILVGVDSKTGSVVDLEEDDWEEIYEYLFGGFEDIGSSDDDDDDEEEDVNTDDELEAMQKKNGEVVKQTKEGYVKDGFIVEDEEEEEDEDASDDDEESETTPPPKKGRKPGTKNQNITMNKSNAVVAAPIGDLNVEDCESELSEESYD
jgi:hypothetical protein